MTLQEIKDNWTDTDKIIYKTPEIKFKSIEESKKRITRED